MRYRKLSATGDMVFGRQQQDFHKDTPAGVAQAVMTRLRLFSGEWFLDTSDGTPWRTEVLGKNTLKVYDAVIKDRILGTQGVSSILSYSSSFNGTTRAVSVNATISTIYGQAQLQGTL